MINYKIKTLPEDFIVIESMVLHHNKLPNNNGYFYYILRKSGYTTFEAIDSISNIFNIEPSLIGYGGLKDEDGITEQFISLPLKIDEKLLNSIFWTTPRFLELIYYKDGGSKIEIGELCGNNFHITIRNIPEDFIEVLSQIGKFSTFFINYYGVQRFGLPNNAKTTHLIGKNLINEDYKNALLFLIAQPNKVGIEAKNYINNEKEYFNNLDKRLLAFYQTSYYSFLWNKHLEDFIRRNCTDICTQVEENEISYTYPCLWREKIDLMKNKKIFDCEKAIVVENRIVHSKNERQFIMQIMARFHKVFIDPIYTNKLACVVEFFLPSGCYATVAIPQLLRDICVKYNLKW